MPADVNEKCPVSGTEIPVRRRGFLKYGGVRPQLDVAKCNDRKMLSI